MIAAAVEFIANHATHRPPTATVEGVRIALWSKPLSIEKSRRELGYAPRPIGPALEHAISSIIRPIPIGSIGKRSQERGDLPGAWSWH